MATLEKINMCVLPFCGSLCRVTNAKLDISESTSVALQLHDLPVLPYTGKNNDLLLKSLPGHHSIIDSKVDIFQCATSVEGNVCFIKICDFFFCDGKARITML